MSETLALLIRVNLAAGAAVALVLVLRKPLRRVFGPGVAYGLWALPVLAALAMLAPAQVVTVPVAVAPVLTLAEAPVHVAGPARPGVAHLQVWPLVEAVWLAGALASFAWLAWRQAQFARAARAGRAGPAVVGILRPQVVTPADFERRYSEREREIILAHERRHIARADPRVNAAMALARCLSWFNPMAHLAARALRIDQELACDAEVIAAFPKARRAYAEAMLKTQLAARPLPLGCHWPAEAAHPLAERIGLLARAAPDAGQRRLGLAGVGLLGLAVAWSAWALRPPQVVARPVPIAMPSAAPTTPALPRQAAPATRPQAPAPAPKAAAPPDLVPEAAPEGSPSPVTGRVIPAGPQDHRISDADVARPGRPAKVFAAAVRSSVEPGSAVRVLATMSDRDGVGLVTDLTAFGSQAFYRIGRIDNRGSRYRLFTAVVQHGEKLTVTASLDRRFGPFASGEITLASGETGTIRLPSGEEVQVTATLRPETPQEVAAGQAMGQRRYVRVDRMLGLF
jgi:beta-lactamase regulating signal transducer with metallopeptidase domain